MTTQASPPPSRLKAALARWSWAAYPVGLFAATRVALFGYSAMAMSLVNDLWKDGGLRKELLQKLPAFDGLCRWDCPFFVRIANEGYSEVGLTNFFPLLPLLTRGLSALGVHSHLAVILVPNAASLLSYLVLYRLFEKLEGEPAARWGLGLFAAYPFAFFQGAAYPESLMVLFTAWAMLLAMSGKPWRAGLALGVGVLARHVALLAGPGLLVAQLRQRPSLRRFLFSPAVLALAVPWLFLGAWCAYQYFKFHDALAFAHMRANWGPLAYWGIGQFVLHKNAENDVVMGCYVVVALVPTVGAAALLFRRRWAELAAATVPLLAVFWAVGLLGLGRYSASAWGAFVPLGVFVSRRPNLQIPAVLVMAMFQGLFFWLFTHQFIIL